MKNYFKVKELNCQVSFTFIVKTDIKDDDVDES